jgi:hypothetical protein
MPSSAFPDLIFLIAIQGLDIHVINSLDFAVWHHWSILDKN